LRDFDAVALVFGRLDVEFAARGGEDRGDGFVVCFYSTTGSAKGIDQDLDAFLALRFPVCAVQQLFNPCFGQSTIRLIEVVADDRGSDGVLRGGLGILDSNVAIGGLFGPKNVVKGYRLSGLVFWNCK
jgi:hypothetical protein